MNSSQKFQDLEWGFPTQSLSAHETGVVQQGIQSFKDVIPSIARESIQNSLDAAQPNGNPVKVRFVFKMIDLEKEKGYDNFLTSAETHIRLCRDKYKAENEEYKAKIFNDMLSTLERFKKIGRLPYLEISDFNTIGMYYDRLKPDFGRMSSFMHKDGDNNSANGGNNRGGGYNGIGKMAYFGMSPFFMVLASTHAIKNNTDPLSTAESFFSGAIKLSTHPCPDNPTIKYQYAGYFPPIPSHMPYLPLTEVDSMEGFPFRFSRKSNKDSHPEMGTTFYIIGCEPTIGFDDKTRFAFKTLRKSKAYDEDFAKYAQKIYHEQLLPSILRNYFVAIKKGLLEVELGKTVVDTKGQTIPSIVIRNDEKLEYLMKNSFKDDILRGSDNIQKTLNPRPFLEALNAPIKEPEKKGTDTSREERYLRRFELDLDRQKDLKDLAPEKTWGKVRCYVNVNPDFSNNMIICMRAPLMTVCKYKVDNVGGRYAGLLICDEEGNYANQLLRASESATHSSWNSKDASLPGHGESSEVAQALLDTIKTWVESKLEELFPRNTKSDVYAGMRNILAFYDPQDATQRHQDLNIGTNALSDETTNITIKKRSKKTNAGTQLSQVAKEWISESEDGDGRTGGGSNGGEGGNQSGVTDPKTKVKSDSNGMDGKKVSKVPLKVRSFINSNTFQDGFVYSVVVSEAAEKYDRIDMHLFAKGENAREPLKLKSIRPAEGCNVKKQRDNIISFSIDKGQSVRFEVVFELNNMPYSLQAVSTVEASEEYNMNKKHESLLF